MKKIILAVFIVILGTQICFAEEESIDEINSYFNDEQEQTEQLNGYLEYNNNAEQKEEDSIELNRAETTGINLTKPSDLGSKSLIKNAKKTDFQPLQEKLEAASKSAFKDYDMSQHSASFTQNYGKFTFGTSYGSYLDSAQTNYTTSLFSRYEGRHVALTTGVTRSTNNNRDYNDDAFSSKFYIAPELKLTKRLSLLDVMQTDANQINKKNEIVLRYTPHMKKYADDVQFEVGAGQSYYQDDYTNASIRFSTRFKL